MTDISGQGRLGADPVLKTFGQDEKKQSVCELRVKYLNSKLRKNKDEESEKEYDDLGFWVQVSVWGVFAESAANLLKKGDRVYIPGSLYMDSWVDKKDPEKEQSMLKLNTNYIFPYLPDIQSLEYKARKTAMNKIDSDNSHEKTGTDG